jgi:hypothetical protein
MSKWIVTAVSGSLVLAGALAWNHFGTPASRQAAAAPTRHSTTPTGARARTPSSRFADREPGWVTAPVVSAAPSPEPEDSAELEPPRLSDNLQQYGEYRDGVFTGDTRDRSWEIEAETRLREGLQSLLVPGSSVLSLECRASLCKTVIDSRDLEVLSKVSSQVLHSFFWTGPAMITRTNPASESDFRLVAFFGREGQELPDG